jgi:hypothetical protein
MTKAENKELMDQLEIQKDVIARKTNEYEELKGEIETMGMVIERYEYEVKSKIEA